MENPKGLATLCITSVQPPETSAQTLASPSRPQYGVHRPVLRDWVRVQTALATSSRSALKRRAEKINACCVAPMYVLTGKGEIGTAPGFCRDRMCPTCQIRRSRATAQKVTALVVRMDSPRFLTLTLRHEHRELFLTMAALSAAFRAMRRTKAWLAHVHGGVYAVEVTRNSQTGCWHAHVHIVYEGIYWQQADISAAWKAASDGSYICDIRAVHTRSAAANYIAKYVAKPNGMAEWPVEAICEYAADMAGRRLIHTFGASYAEEIDDESAGEIKAECERLCSANRLLHWAAKSDAYALRAVELLARVGGIATAASGQSVPWCMGGRPRLEAWEITLLVESLREIRDRPASGDVALEIRDVLAPREEAMPTQLVMAWLAYDLRLGD